VLLVSASPEPPSAIPVELTAGAISPEPMGSLNAEVGTATTGNGGGGE
jgi:hypothetical protein